MYSIIISSIISLVLTLSSLSETLYVTIQARLFLYLAFYSLGIGHSCLYYILLRKFQELVVEPSSFVKGQLGCRFSLSSCNSPNFYSLCFHRVPQNSLIFLINKLLHFYTKNDKIFQIRFSIYSNFISITICMLINNRVNIIFI